MSERHLHRHKPQRVLYDPCFNYSYRHQPAEAQSAIMIQPHWLSERLNLSHRTLPIIHTFCLQKSHHFKLRISSFSYQKEKLRSEEVTSMTLILGGKSNLRVEGWWETACCGCQALPSTGFKGPTSSESKSWRNGEKAQGVRVWPWPLVTAGEILEAF